MKSAILSISAAMLLCINGPATAQWPADPANPGVVCGLDGLQNSVRSFADDNEGVYVFWLDARLNPGSPAREVYGQRYDKDGYPLWESNGRLIASHYNQISSYRSFIAS